MLDLCFWICQMFVLMFVLLWHRQDMWNVGFLHTGVCAVFGRRQITKANACF